MVVALAVICSGTAWAVLPVGRGVRRRPRRPRRRAALVLGVVPAPAVGRDPVVLARPAVIAPAVAWAALAAQAVRAALVHRAPLAVSVHPAATTPAAAPAVAAV